MSDRVLEINGMNSGYGSVQILYDIGLYVDKGEFVTIIGPVSYTHLTLPTILRV